MGKPHLANKQDIKNSHVKNSITSSRNYFEIYEKWKKNVYTFWVVSKEMFGGRLKILNVILERRMICISVYAYT